MKNDIQKFESIIDINIDMYNATFKGIRDSNFDKAKKKK